jgi:hypothetical protein
MLNEWGPEWSNRYALEKEMTEDHFQISNDFLPRVGKVALEG